jgi:hypothetical protein
MNDGQRLDAFQALRVQVVQKLLESVDVIGDFREVGLFDVQAHGLGHGLYIVLGEVCHRGLLAGCGVELAVRSQLSTRPYLASAAGECQ